MTEPDVLTISALFLPAKHSSGDPLAQREYIALKLTGALYLEVAAGDTAAAVNLFRNTIAERVEAALRDAISKPDETVVSVTGAC